MGICNVEEGIMVWDVWEGNRKSGYRYSRWQSLCNFMTGTHIQSRMKSKYFYFFFSLRHFQPCLLISIDDHVYHKLIGTSLLSASAISVIKNSDNSHSRIFMPFYFSPQSRPTKDGVLYSRYCASVIHIKGIKQFSALPAEDFILQAGYRVLIIMSCLPLFVFPYDWFHEFVSARLLWN